ncbi:MAG: MFS transporter [Thermoplasmata archaeon]|nr:MFS transporter [Thermoplasmata archaeon]
MAAEATPSPTVPSAGVTARLLRNRNFCLLLVGYAASVTGIYVGNVVIEWLIATFNTAREAAILLTILGIIELVPTLTIGVFAGAWADRYDRRQLMIGTQIARAATFAALALLVLREGFSPIVVLGAVFVLSALGSIYGPAFNSFLPRVVDTTELTPANGILEFGGTVSGFVGSPLGGALVFLLGIGVGFLTNSILYALSALAIGLMVIPFAVKPDSEESKKKPTSPFSEVRAGLSFLRSQRALLTLTLVGMIANFFTYYLVFVVLYTRSFLHAGPTVFGLLLGASSVGYAVGALLPHRLKTDRSPGVWIPLTWGLSGVPLMVMIVLPVVPLAIGSMAVIGCLNSIIGVTFTSVVQRTVPDKLLGRVFATDSALSYAMIPAGLAFGGFLLVAYGVGPAFLVAGAGTLGTGLSPLLSREVRAWGKASTTGSPT